MGQTCPDLLCQKNLHAVTQEEAGVHLCPVLENKPAAHVLRPWGLPTSRSPWTQVLGFRATLPLPSLLGKKVQRTLFPTALWVSKAVRNPPRADPGAALGPDFGSNLTTTQR